MSKRQLEIYLARLRTLENPHLDLEQYPVSPEVASELLLMGAFEHRDLRGYVVDLGTGTGRLAIGAALLGSTTVVGVDLDLKAVGVARENAADAMVDVDWVAGDIASIRGRVDAVIMNPPYGTRLLHGDAKFLEKSFELAPVTYSIHKSSTRDFVARFVEEHGRKVDEVRSMRMRIPHLFSFHRRRWGSVEVDLYRIAA